MLCLGNQYLTITWKKPDLKQHLLRIQDTAQVKKISHEDQIITLKFFFFNLHYKL